VLNENVAKSINEKILGTVKIGNCERYYKMDFDWKCPPFRNPVHGIIIT